MATNNFDPSKFLYKTKQEQEQEEEVLVEGETHTDRQSKKMAFRIQNSKIQVLKTDSVV